METRRLALASMTVAFLLLPMAVSGADGEDVKSLAGMDLMKLKEIPIISAARREQNRAESPRSVSVITAEEIRRRNFRNIPEAVAGLTGVFLQQTNYAAGSPIIRGMVGNRILIMVNGIRLNNAIYRLGPNQYLNFIDINQVERIEVVRGAGSVLYGSDAFGGVINVITKSAPDPRMGSEFSGALHVRYSSADQSGAGRAEFSGVTHGLGIAGGYTREGFNDLEGGSGSGLQRYTGYSQAAGDLQLRYSLGADRNLVAGISRLQQRDVSRTDLLRAGSDLEYLWNPEGRDMAYLQYSQPGIGRYIDALQVTLAYQRPFEDLHRIVATAPSVERQHVDEVNTSNVTLQFTSRLRTSQILTYGFEANSDWVTSTRSDLNLLNGTRATAKGNYPDGSRFSSASLFLQDEISLFRRLHAVLGIRHDRFQIRSETTDSMVGQVDVNSSPSAWTGSGYLLYDLSRSVSVVAGIAQGFRAPNLDDSTVLGGVSGRFEIPNAQLQPERSTGYEYGLRFKNRRASLSLAYFEDRYRSLIDRSPALLHGLPFLDSNGNGIRDGKELDVYQRRNVGSAHIHGVEAEATVLLTDTWTWTHTTTWTHGKDVSGAAPLSKIPPLNGVSRLTWQPNKTVWMEAAAVAAMSQHRLSPGDITDVRIGPAGTAGFAVFHLRAGLNRTVLAGLSVTWQNVTNHRYRLHGSGFDGPGAGVVVGFQRAF